MVSQVEDDSKAVKADRGDLGVQGDTVLAAS